MAPLALEPKRRAVFVRRLVFTLLVCATMLVISWQALAMLSINGLTPLKMVIFVLFVVLLIPIALSFWTALIGALVQWTGGDELDLSHALPQRTPGKQPLPRAAVIMPIYNEDPVRVFAGVKATYESLERTGFLDSFDLFILSDTLDPDVWVREEMAFGQMRAEVSAPERLIYRNRRKNLERKTGNIADFCETWGDQYTYMIVFDADSIMTGLSMVNLVRLMEKHPRVGIIQVPPLPVNRGTLFGRVHQFAMHAYSLIFITGLNFWQGGAANYWGHNAIIRIGPFIEHCKLPTLPGKQPLGGSILSHDFVEAAFMRRAGWKVYLASELSGSYEELPSSLIGYAARDRRWCQGNLQHTRLLFTPGLHLVSRVHLLMGVMSYLASGLWLLLLALSTAEGIKENVGPHQYFSHDKVLFPSWQISVAHRAILMFAVMMSLLLIPKVLSWVTHLRDRHRLGGFGGGKKLTSSVLLELLFSSLLAPNLALLQARFVIGTLMGYNVKWESQDWGEASTTFREAFSRHWPATALGLIWTVILALTAPKLLWWFSPVILGLLLAIPLSAWSSRTSLGQRAKAKGLFLIPEEIAPPLILQRLHEELAQAEQRPWSNHVDGLSQVLQDRRLLELHLGQLPPAPEPKDPLHQNHLEGLQLKLRHQGVETLTPQEKRELLLDADSVRELHRILGEAEMPVRIAG